MSICCLRWAISLSLFLWVIILSAVHVFGMGLFPSKTVQLDWKQDAIASEYIYKVNFVEVNNPSANSIVNVDGKKSLIINDWYQQFGRKPISVKVKASRKIDKAESAWSQSVVYTYR
jgi:hypothetical protein